MMTKLTGREKERKVLENALLSNESEMVSVIGRRRIGKTFLVKTVYKQHLCFTLTGTKNAPFSEQLQNFNYALQLSSKGKYVGGTPANWMEAFFMLINYLKANQSKKKQVVFFDELPWLSTHKSGFLRGLSFFWNSWAVDQNIVVVICGSAASWMIQKVVNDTGGLHNRITKRLHLKPFTLYETEQYLHARGIKLNRYHLAQVYMAVGGVPHYLKEIKAGQSAAQIIQALCFSETGLLRDEFTNLYAALFDHADKHIEVIRALAQKNSGLSRKEIIETSALHTGGGLSKVLDELMQSGFIEAYFPFSDKKTQKRYRLTDEYSLFYLRFIEKNIKKGKPSFLEISQTQAYKIWCGYAFENICLKHIPQIKKALEIGGVHTVSSTFYKKGTATVRGTQIDLVLDRNDQTINLFEIKFHNKALVLSKSYAETLKTKRDIFEETTRTKKHIFLTLISTFGLNPNEHSLGLIDGALELGDLFLE